MSKADTVASVAPPELLQSSMFKQASFSRFLLVALLLLALDAALVGAEPQNLLTSESTTTTLEPAPSTDLEKLDPLVLLRLDVLDGHSPIIVRARDAASVAVVSALIQQLGGTPGRNLSILDALAAELPNVALPTLAASPDVKRIALDRLMLGFVERTGATVGVSTAREEFGYDGSGVGVAVIDSGVASWHDDLAESGMTGTQRVRSFVDFVANAPLPYDDWGHGTHVAGIIAGNGADSSGKRTGMAPAAHLVVLKVLDQNGRGKISNLIAALDYVLQNQASFNIRVVNLSVGAGVYESYDSDLLTLAVKRVVEQGIVVVAAAGNMGLRFDGKVVYGSINAPGNAPWVLTVGASSHMGNADRSDDTMAAFSSRGPTLFDRLAKPDVVAPGVGIVSLSDPNSFLYSYRSQNLVTGTVATPAFPYLSLTGTSQATPVVSGTVALMLQANPALTPNAVKALVEYTSEVYPSHDPLTQGAGFLNSRGAIALARFFAQWGEYPVEPQWSRRIIWGNHRVQDGMLLPWVNAWLSGLTWGSAKTADGQPITWGVICTQLNCETWDTWQSWGMTCSDAGCTDTVAPQSSYNVVWGSTCGGVDCEGTAWSTVADDDTVVWGNQSDDDTVVWGNQGDDDTVVWGNQGDDDTVVWGNTGTDQQHVNWPEPY